MSSRGFGVMAGPNTLCNACGLKFRPPQRIAKGKQDAARGPSRPSGHTEQVISDEACACIWDAMQLSLPPLGSHIFFPLGCNAAFSSPLPLGGHISFPLGCNAAFSPPPSPLGGHISYPLAVSCRLASSQLATANVMV
jgi:hypothetical protein